MSEHEFEWVRVACPDCGNVNRHARRRCKATKGACKGTGEVLKRRRVDARPQPTRVPLDVARVMAGGEA